MAQRYCTNCGNELGPNDIFCANCGKPAHETAAVSTPEANVDVPTPPGEQQAGGARNFGPTGAAPRSRSLAGRLFVGCTGLIVLAVVFVGCLALLPGGGDTTGGGADKEPQQEQAAQQADQEADQEAQEEAERAQQEEQAQQEEEAAQEEAEQRAAEQQAEEERQAAEERERREEAAASRAVLGETVRAGDAEWTVTNARRVSEIRQKGFGQFGESKQGNFVVMDFTFTNQANDSVTLDSLSLPLFDSQGRQYEADTDTFGYIPAQKDIFLNQVNPGVTQEGQIIYSVAPDSRGYTVHAGDLSLFGGEEARIALGF